MATQPALLPIEEYLHTAYSPDVDYVDGVLEKRNLGEFEHGRLTGLLFAFFHARAKELGVVPVIEQRVRVAASRVRICDFVLIRAGGPREPVTKTAPLLCIEILSPEDRLARANVVLADYRAMGVENIWLLDPMREAAYTFDTEGLKRHEGVLSIDSMKIALDPASIFAKIG